MDIRSGSTGKVPFRDGDKQLSWDEATARFHDSTGRPGPKDWIQGEYPKGQDDFPVTGISWYGSRGLRGSSLGKSLPTIFHWNAGAGTGFRSLYRACQQLRWALVSCLSAVSKTWVRGAPTTWPVM